VIPKAWLDAAQLISSAAAACGLFVAACQIYRARVVADQSRRAADLQALQKFFEGVFEREAALAAAADNAAEQRHAFNVLLNFLEIHAGAHNRNLFGPGCDELVRHKLEDSVIELEAAVEWHPLIQSALDRSTTFAELRVFIERNRDEITERRSERERHHASQAALNDL
jgi:hypothetical protein